MLSFYDAAAIATAPTSVSTDPTLNLLIADRVRDWAAADLLGLTHLLIVQPGDTEAEIIDDVAFSPIVNPLNGRRFGSKDFEPCWDWLERHDGWFEMIVTVGNDGFAFVLFIQDSGEIDPALHRLCQTFAPPPSQERHLI